MPVIPEDGRHRHLAHTRFSDSDAMGHINHARFLAYLEDARVALFRALGRGDGFGSLILARLEIDYVRPLWVREEPLLVTLWVTAIGRSSFTIEYSIEQDGDVAARARSVQVAYDYEAGRSRPLDEAERRGLERWLAAAATV